jgi:acetylglutamate kinase
MTTMPTPARAETAAAPRSARALLVKLGGAAIDEAERHTALFSALADLHRDLAGGIVIVHGGGATVDRRLQRLGLSSEKREGIRITPPEHLDEVIAALAGVVNTRLVGALQKSGVRAAGLSLGDGGLARCTRATGYSFDPGCVGEITGADPRLIDLLVGSGYLPVICSVGLDEHGRPLNINADDAAAALASKLSAAGLLLLTDVPGVVDGDGALLPELDRASIESLIASGQINGGMIPKVRGALHAAEAAAAPVIIASWTDPAAIRRLARGEAVGTRILPSRTPRALGTDLLAASFRSERQ